MKWFGSSKAREANQSARVTPRPLEESSSRGSIESTEEAPSPPRAVLFVTAAAEAALVATRLEELRERWLVEPVASGEEALARLAQKNFDAVVAPAVIQDMPGGVFLKAVAQKCRGTIRMWRGPLDGVSQAIEPGGMPPYFIAEPVELEDLDAALRRAFALERWMGGEPTRSLLSRMENLPAMPSLYAQVLAELQQDAPSIDGIAERIAQDPALTARMLQTVNSPIFGLRRPVGTAFEAVTFLGAERTKALILMASLSLHGGINRCEGFSQDHFWHHSLSVATWARCLALAEMKNASEADQAFTAGILHDIGKLLFASNVPLEYGRALAETHHRNVSVHDAEKTMLTISHGCLGASLLGTWGLPMPLLEAVAWHNCPSESGDKSFSLLTAVHVANALEYERKPGDPNGPGAQLDAEYLARLGIDSLLDRWRQLIGCRPRGKQP